MTDRERWIVYPLIFLTLGIALKDKLVEAVDLKCRNLFCNSVVVTDAKGTQQALVSSDVEGGFVRTRGTNDGLNVILGHTDQFGGLMFVDRAGVVSVNPGSILQAASRPPKTPRAEPPGVKADAVPDVPPPEPEAP